MPGEVMTAALNDALAANPWARPLVEPLLRGSDRRAAEAAQAAGAAARAARAVASLARMAGDRAGWAAWAETMARARAALSSASAARAGDSGDEAAGARALIAFLATTDLCGAPATTRIELGGRLCPGDVLLGDAVSDERIAVDGEIWLDAAEIRGDLVLSGTVDATLSLQNVQLFGDLVADGATVCGRVEATGIVVVGATRFEACAFRRDVWCRNARFGGPVRMIDCVFQGEVGFLGAAFAAPTSLAGARFERALGLERAAFDAAVDVAGASVGGKVWAGGAVFAREADRLALAALSREAGADGAARPDGAAQNVVHLADYIRRKRGA